MSIKEIFNKFDNDKEEDIFYVRSTEQKRTTSELIEESKLTQSYYFMLFFAAIITVAGILMDNFVIVFAGMAASFAWTKKKEMYEALSGAAIAATLLPPLAIIGVMTTKIETAGLRDALFVFLYNMATITGGSGLVFILSGFIGKKDVQKEIEKGLEKEEG